jgi:hypothetical protein
VEVQGGGAAVILDYYRDVRREQIARYIRHDDGKVVRAHEGDSDRLIFDLKRFRNVHASPPVVKGQE